jgi:tetratricopeptide (TPR) repeat protein
MKSSSRASNQRSRHSTRPADVATDSSWSQWVMPLLLALATFAVFSPALSNQFVNWDDDLMLVDNPNYRGLGWTQLRWMFSTFLAGHYQPLSWITLGLDYLLWGVDPFGYHLTNLILHVLNTLIFYFVCRQLFTKIFVASRELRWQLDLSAAVATIFFALHPLRVESVVWATERRDVLSGGFFLAAIYCYLRAQKAATGTSISRNRWLALAFAAQLLSLMAKATAITLPVVLVILDIYPLQRLRGAVRNWFSADYRRVLAEKLPFLLLSLIFGVVALWAQQNSGALRPVQLYFFSYRLGQAFYGICFYIWKTVLPIGLSPLYELPYDFEAWTGVFMVCAAITLLASSLVFLIRRRWPWLAACWAYYVILLSPVLGVAQSGSQLVADRYSYLSCLSWAALVGGMAFFWMQSAKSARVATTAVGIVVISAGLALLTRAQVGVWHDTESLWKHTLRVTPNTAIANYNLGKFYETDGNGQNSAELYRRAVAINPTHAEAHYNLARLLGQHGQLDEAIAHYREALKFKPNDVETHNNLGQLLALQGNVTAALTAYQKALALDPQFAKAYFNLGRLFVRSGEFDKAIDSFQQALKLTPDIAEVHAGLGDAYARAGNLDQAIVHLEVAVKLKPQLGGVEMALARLYQARGSKIDTAQR